VRPDLFIKKVVILSVAPAEKAAAAVDATELELVLVERVSNSRIDTVIRGSLPTRVIIVKKAERDVFAAARVALTNEHVSIR
jgi:predicted methyltransferase MtxX (methanogen marker protein 4)